MKKILLILLLIFLFISAAHCDYLEVKRSAHIRFEADSQSISLEKADIGDYLQLPDSVIQVNGYYKVFIRQGLQEGWIYRTLVSRKYGTIPGSNTGHTAVFQIPPPPHDYYESVENLIGDDLKEALYNIIKNHREFTYDDVWDILKETDIDSLNPSKVIGFYSGFLMNAAEEYNNQKGWTREHVWAKSFGQFGTRMGAGTDVHHLRAADVSTNTERNNKTFDYCETPYIDQKGVYRGNTYSFTNDDDWTWEPRDQVKGDVARMLFYMAVRYEGENDEPDLELVDRLVPKTNKEPIHGKLSVLLEWHEQDPVDNYEKYRNHVIYSKYQHNRNPFIDHPEFVRKIW